MASVSTWMLEHQRLSKEFTSLYRKLGINPVTQEFIVEWRKLESNSADMMKVLSRRLQNFKKSVVNLKENLVDLISEGKDVGKFLENIEEKLTSFKRVMKGEYEALALEEQQLNEDVELYYKSLPEWEEGLHDEKENRLEMKAQHEENLDKELANRALIGAIDRQLASLGKFGGWDSRDHDVFLKIWTQLGTMIISAAAEDNSHDVIKVLYQEDNKTTTSASFAVTNRGVLLRKLLKMLPGMMVPELEDHIKWYVMYARLQEKKRELVEDWKQKKKIDKVDQIEKIESEVIRLSPDAAHEENLIAKEESRRKAKERLENWRKAKEDKEKEDKLMEQKMSEAERRQREEQIRERQELARQQLRKWKEEENTKKQLSVAPEVKARPASADPAEIMRRRQRDIELGKVRHAKVVEKAQEPLLRQHKQKEIEDKISAELFSRIGRDTSRLLSKTKVAIAQHVSRELNDQAANLRINASAHSRPIAMSARDIRGGVRATPAWCRPPPH